MGMNPLRVRERVQREERLHEEVPQDVAESPLKPMRMETVVPRRVPAGQNVRVHKVQERLHNELDSRVQRELAEMQETDDLNQIDDDVEDVATLYAWMADEHTHRPKSPRWYVVLATATTVIAGTLLFFNNIMGAVTMAFIGGLTYYISQKKPGVFRYRLLVDGVAVNNLLYHYRDLATFNIIYEPGEAKTVLIRGKRRLAPLLHMEIGEADPVAIREILLEFLPEDQTMDEPMVDVIARRLGF
jgi:hypothetical protein